jgi:hypothetical protein
MSRFGCKAELGINNYVPKQELGNEGEKIESSRRKLKSLGHHFIWNDLKGGMRFAFQPSILDYHLLPKTENHYRG